MDIVFYTDTLFEEAQRTVSFETRDLYNEGIPLYDTLKLTDQERPLVEDSIRAAATLLCTAFSDFLSQRDGGNAVVIEASLPDSAKLETFMSIRRNIHDLILNHAVSQWFGISDSDLSGKYKEKADAEMESLKRNLYKKRKPARRTDWMKIKY